MARTAQLSGKSPLPDALSPVFRHRFTSDQDGALAGRAVQQCSSPLTWQVTGSRDTHVVSGTAGYPAGETADGASYFHPGSIPGGLVAVGARIVFPVGDKTGASCAIGLFTSEPFTGASNASPAHLAITPYGLEMAVFTGGVGNFERLRPLGDPLTPTMAEFANPLICDGTTEHFVFVLIDRVRGECYAYAPDGRVYRYRHARFRDTLGLIPFFEPFGQAANGPVGRFAEVWGYARLPSVPDGPVAPISVAHARSQSESGAGPPTARPSSRAVPPGSMWRDTTNGKPTHTDGLVWRDDADQVVGNLLSRQVALAHRDQYGISGLYCTVDRVSSPRPDGRACCYKITASQAGTIGVYTGNASLAKYYTPVTAGQQYTVGVGKIAAAGTARTAYVTATPYNDANGAAGAVVNGANASTGANGAFSSTQPTATITPASPATQLGLTIVIGGVAAGEVFYLDELFIAPGTTTYLEP